MHLTAGSLAVAFLFTALAARVDAVCNLIPQRSLAFAGALGTTNRPFAAPGESVELSLRSCDTGSPGFSANAGDQVVTVVFTPAAGGPRNVVVLATDCTVLAVALQACRGTAGVAGAVCRTVSPGADLAVRTGGRDLVFQFPDTDDLLQDPSDRRTLAGPATIAVTRASAPLPCGLATAPCSQTGLLACIDDFFNDQGSCLEAPPSAKGFAHFTALPPPNDYHALCGADMPPCNLALSSNELRVGLDSEGNLLLPVDWQGILVPSAIPVPRLMRATVDVPIRVPGASFLASFTPEGGPLPPIFVPQADPSNPNVLALFGSADAPYSVLRLARRSQSFPSRVCTGGTNGALPCNDADDCPGGSCDPTATCVGGSQAGQHCDGDADCPGSECGPSLFDFTGALVGGAGPVVIHQQGTSCPAGQSGTCQNVVGCGDALCDTYALQAQSPVPLDGLVQTPDVFAFTLSEAIAGKDLNGDGDMLDSVLTPRDRRTGEALSIGVGGAPGRAVARINEPPFSFPAVAAEGDVLAFLEPEPFQFDVDANGNGQDFEPILRVFRGATQVTSGVTRAVDAALAIDGRSLAVSNGLVFFRTPEAATAPRTTIRAGTFTDIGPVLAREAGPELSADGRFVAFVSTDPSLVPDDTDTCVAYGTAYTTPGTCPDVFVFDRLSAKTVRVSVASDGSEGNFLKLAPSISGDGRFVGFATEGGEFVPGYCGAYVHDRDADGNGVFDETGPGKQSTECVNLVDGSADRSALPMAATSPLTAGRATSSRVGPAARVPSRTV